MSNVIKSYAVRFQDDTRMTIDTHLRMEKVLEEKRRSLFQAAVKPPEGFVEGLNAVVVEALPNEEEMQGKNNKTIEAASEEANNILEQAKKEAEKIKNEAYTAGHKRGYDEGNAQALKELAKSKAEYEALKQKLQREYQETMQSLEPEVAKLIAALLEKITGILVEDKDEVILYLVSKALRNMESSTKYTIRVSKEDYEYIALRKDLLQGGMERETTIYITEDATLKKNQCLIETETKTINCSLDVQLNNLITDLKLLGSI